MGYCAYCGTALDEGVAACAQCGHPVGAPIGASFAMEGGGERATFGIRFLGWLIDAVIVGVAAVFVTPGSPILWFLYTWLMVAFNDGRTVGKMAVGLRVIAVRDQRAPDVGRAAARAGMSIVSWLPLGLGYLWAAWESEGRTWHDIVAETSVVRSS